MNTVCDHSLPNPEVLDYLVQNGGEWPASTQPLPRSAWSEFLLADLRAADYIVVNSDFVKESFVRFGWEAARIAVHYTGVDDDFFQALPPYAPRRNPRPRALFAGELSRRKGIEVLAAAMSHLNGLDFDLELIGSTASADSDYALSALRADARIQFSDYVPRRTLAQRMSAADIFVFPSLAEGSARVVFMALGSGCHAIVTPNAGSIVQDGVHGNLVPPGDARVLAEALTWAVQHPGEIAAIGRQNAALIRSEFVQQAYGRQTRAFYENLQPPA